MISLHYLEVRQIITITIMLSRLKNMEIEINGKCLPHHGQRLKVLISMLEIMLIDPICFPSSLDNNIHEGETCSKFLKYL